MSAPQAVILIVEDDPRQYLLYSKILKGRRLLHARNGTEALAILDEEIPNLVLLDHVLADGEKGLDFLRRIKSRAAHVPVIVISGTLDMEGRLAALQGPGAAHYFIEKPVDIDRLQSTVEQALESCGIGEAVEMLQSLERAESDDPRLPDHQFTERLARHHRLVNQLRKSGERPNITHLSAEYGVSRRTIIRDLQELIRRGQLDESVYPDWNKPE